MVKLLPVPLIKPKEDLFFVFIISLTYKTSLLVNI